MFVTFRRLLTVGLLVLVLLATALVWRLRSPVGLSQSPLEVHILAGSSLHQVALQLEGDGVIFEPGLFELAARLTGQARKVKAGSYILEDGVSSLGILEKLVQGDATQAAFTLVEGWNLRRVRGELARLTALRQDSAALSDAELASRLGVVQLEGRLMPDTYFYSRGSSDLDVLGRAARAMQRQLDSAWAARAAQLPLRSPDEALILASLVEKETGVAEDRARIASVFYNRLAANMPLQTDPSVIYGLGSRFDGNLTRADLLADNPYNTYTRRGLPPSPIAMPGLESLHAALNPPQTPYYYFVARGDGSSEFSRNLEEHNRAVARYIKRKGNRG